MAETSRAELQESFDRGFHQHWPVDRDYRIVEGIVRPLQRRKFVRKLESWRQTAKYYHPMAHCELPAEFAALADCSETEVLEFVRRYGLLGYCQVAKSSPRRHSDLESMLRSLAENQELLNPLVSPRRILRLVADRAIDLGDPLDWILGHAKTVRLVLEAAEALTDSALLTKLIERMNSRDPDTGESFIRFSCFMREERRPTSCSYGPWTDQRRAAMGVISMILDGNSGGVTRSVITRTEGQFTRGGKRLDILALENCFTFKSLLDCIYWLLSDAVLGATIKKCAYCSRYFVATHAKMKYCPPRKGFQGISPCANRHRVQRHRLRRKGPLATTSVNYQRRTRQVQAKQSD